MQFRYARHTDDLDKIIHFYTQIMPFEVLGGFSGHGTYDGVFIGKRGLEWHLEYTSSSHPPEHSFDPDDNLVFYFENEAAFAEYVHNLKLKNIPTIANRNDYWNRYGKTYIDPDGHQVVLAYRPIYPIEDRVLKSEDVITQSLIQQGITTWGELTEYVQQLPYGRNSNRQDFALVIKESKGTCSSKHAFLASIAKENHIKEVQLYMGIYKMDGNNTKGIATVLEAYHLDYIPEAHCYLKINGERQDYTKASSNITLIEQSLLFERAIDADDVVALKVMIHKGFLLDWLEQQNLNYTFDQIWSIREACIQALEG